MKVILIQLWFGKIPDYFWFHYETTKNLDINFLFVTDQEINLESQNYKVIKTTREFIENKLSLIFNNNFEIKNNKKVCDLKSSLGFLFEKEIIDYDYFGFYDIDTLFGDIQKYTNQYLGNYDFISIGDEVIHNRLSGPFTIIKNTDELRKLFICEEFLECHKNPEVQCFEEHILNKKIVGKYSIKLIDSTNFSLTNGGILEYNALWSGGKIIVNFEEKMLYHFYRKKETSLTKVGSTISAKLKKKLVDDFLWVVHFSEKYETLLPFLMDSIKKYSNRKCLLYSINYTPTFLYKTQFESDQFIFKRIDMETNKIDNRGRDVTILNSKPVILMDAINSFPNKKFVHIDTDVYLTTNSDNITSYFDMLDNYPLMNLYIHDVMYLSGLRENEEWTSSLHILLETLGEKKPPIFPRRKCNFILFDSKSYWFLDEQMKIYQKYKDENIPGLFAIYDEDTANALLAKYEFTKSLPLIDLEESYNLNVEKIFNYSYNLAGTSEWVKLPKSINDLLIFHGFKKPEDYIKIQNEYGKSVLNCEDIVVRYFNETIFIEKNTFLIGKTLQKEVNFVIYDMENNELFNLTNQKIYDYSIFYVSNIILPNNIIIKIFEVETQKCVFNSVFCLL